MTKQLARSFGNDMAPSKWTWGVELTDDNLRGLIRGADRQGHDSHTGYDSPLPSNFSHGKISSSLDPYKLEDPQSTQLLFDRLSSSIATIPELPPDEFPSYSEINGEPREERGGPEPDLVIEAFSKRAKAEAIQARKRDMQDEVDQPVAYNDYGSEFISQIALIPKCPWLMPRRPIILPPTNSSTIPSAPNHRTEPEGDDQLPDVPHAESDNNLHTDSPDSSSNRSLPVSDDHGSDAMDIVMSDEHDIQMLDANTESGTNPVFPESPVNT